MSRFCSMIKKKNFQSKCEMRHNNIPPKDFIKPYIINVSLYIVIQISGGGALLKEKGKLTKVVIKVKLFQ